MKQNAFQKTRLDKPQPQKVILIKPRNPLANFEVTEKKHKAIMVVGNVMTVLGVFLLFFTLTETARGLFSIGDGVSVSITLFIAGILINLTGHFFDWWKHG